MSFMNATPPRLTLSGRRARKAATSRITRPGARFEGYLAPDRPHAGAYDEMFAADGTVRGPYRALYESIAALDAHDLNSRSQALDHRPVERLRPRVEVVRVEGRDRLVQRAVGAADGAVGGEHLVVGTRVRPVRREIALEPGTRPGDPAGRRLPRTSTGQGQPGRRGVHERHPDLRAPSCATLRRRWTHGETSL